MFLISLISTEETKKYIIDKNKWWFSNSYWKISYEELEKLWYWNIFKLWKKQYLITKPTLQDYILYWLKRKTQIIYPFDSINIINQLWLNPGEKIFESWIGSGALSLLLLNSWAELTSFEKRKEFIQLAQKNISQRENFIKQKFNHTIIEFLIYFFLLS